MWRRCDRQQGGGARAESLVRATGGLHISAPEPLHAPRPPSAEPSRSGVTTYHSAMNFLPKRPEDVLLYARFVRLAARARRASGVEEP